MGSSPAAAGPVPAAVPLEAAADTCPVGLPPRAPLSRLPQQARCDGHQAVNEENPINKCGIKTEAFHDPMPSLA